MSAWWRLPSRRRHPQVVADVTEFPLTGRVPIGHVPDPGPRPPPRAVELVGVGPSTVAAGDDSPGRRAQRPLLYPTVAGVGDVRIETYRFVSLRCDFSDTRVRLVVPNIVLFVHV